MTNTAEQKDKVVLGIIGVAGRGFDAHLKTFSQFPDVEIGAVCDVYQPYVERAVAYTEGKAKAYHDYHDLISDPNIDAVVVATPPHWHALMTLDALQAGKDVYCEKPMCRLPVEGRLMTDWAARYGRITQVGTQIHATANYHKCVDVVRSGVLGQITCVRNLCAMNDDSEGLGTPPDEAPLEGLDWESWLGPAPETPFNQGRFRDGMHRYFKDYVDSWLHELGPHIVDLPFWALQLDCPKAIAASGGRYATESIADVPDTMQVTWEWPELLMTWEMMQASSFNFGVGQPGKGRKLGILFHGKNGTLIANYGVCQVLDKDGKLVEGATYPQAEPLSPGHEREFIDSVKSRQECSCSFSRHLPMHTALNLAHLALKLGRKLQWDEAKWEVIGDPEANALLTPSYRAPYKLPAV
jgi:predicted dehydrogenase